jgi:hypothetical protein
MREIGCTTAKIRLVGAIDGSCCRAEMEVLARPVRSEVSSDSFASGRRGIIVVTDHHRHNSPIAMIILSIALFFSLCHTIHCNLPIQYPLENEVPFNGDKYLARAENLMKKYPMIDGHNVFNPLPH